MKSASNRDEALDIAERVPMRLGRTLANIHLHRARLVFRTQPYPLESSQDDLTAAEKLINDCGYVHGWTFQPRSHRRNRKRSDFVLLPSK